MVAGGSYLATGSLPTALATLSIGVLMDGDHLFDYAYYLTLKKNGKRSVSITEFYYSTYMEETKKTIIPFHSYELLPLLWLFSAVFFSLPLATWLTISFLAHLITDYLTYRPHPLAYSLVYRMSKRFSKDILCSRQKENEENEPSYYHKEKSCDDDYTLRPYELRPPTDAIKDKAIEKLIMKKAAVGMKMLDVGCGMGHLCLRLSGQIDTTGIDLSTEAINIARQRSRGVFLQSDAQALPFPDASFDYVVAKDILEHMPDDHKALSEIFRVSRDGARIILYLPAELDGFNMSTEAIVKRLTGYTIDREVGHLRRYTVSSAKDMLQSYGFKSLKSWYLVHFTLGVASLLTVCGFRTLRIRRKTHWLSGGLSRIVVRFAFFLFELLGRLETALLWRLPGAGFFIIAVVKK